MSPHAAYYALNCGEYVYRIENIWTHAPGAVNADSLAYQIYYSTGFTATGRPDLHH